MPEPQTPPSDAPAAGDGNTLRAWEAPVIRILPATRTEEGGDPGYADNGTFAS